MSFAELAPVDKLLQMKCKNLETLIEEEEEYELLLFYQYDQDVCLSLSMHIIIQEKTFKRDDKSMVFCRSEMRIPSLC